MSAVLRLASRLRRHTRAFTVVVIAATFVLISGTAIAALSAGFSSTLVAGRPVLAIGLGLVVGVGAAAVLTWVEQWVAHVLAYRVIDSLRIELHRSIARIAPLGLGRRTTGETVARAVGDADALEWFYAHTAAQVIAGSIASMAFSVVAVSVAGPAGLIVPAAHLLLVAVPLASMSRARRQGDLIRREIADLSAAAFAARRFARESVLLGQRDTLNRDILERTRRVQSARRATATRLGLEQSTSELIGAGLTLSALTLTVAGLAHGTYDPILAPVWIAFAASSTSAVLVVATALGKLGEVQAAAARVDELLDAPGTRPTTADTTQEPTSSNDKNRAPAEVRVEALRVSYPGGGTILDGIDLVAVPGEILAVAGKSGQGKSTLLLALAHLIPTTEGRILISGTRESPRAQVSLVGQHAHVFRATIRDNLLAPTADDDRLWAALETAQLTDHVKSTPHGLSTKLDEAGAGWSGGERQRLGLARGLTRDAPVLLLDEPTAGLDSTTEATFLSTLRKIAGERTIIIVTHREPVMRAATRVALLHKGRIVDEGTYDELRIRSTAFQDLLADPQPLPPD